MRRNCSFSNKHAYCCEFKKKTAVQSIFLSFFQQSQLHLSNVSKSDKKKHSEMKFFLQFFFKLVITAEQFSEDFFLKLNTNRAFQAGKNLKISTQTNY